MEKKINIAEILRDCPPGTELYSPLCGTCVFDRLNMGTIICKKQNTQEITFTSEGYYMLPVFDDCECVLFPSKGQRDWNKFQRPFKDGDILYIDCTGDECRYKHNKYIFILKEISDGKIYCYCYIDEVNKYKKFNISWLSDMTYTPRFATEEEKQKLFDAIKENGYKWNADTKTLEKIVEPKFKVGDIIQDKYGYRVKITEVNIDDEYYVYISKILNGINSISFKCQIDWELVSDKIEPKFKVGDRVKRKNTNEEHTITKVTEDRYEYSITKYCNGYITIKLQDDWELVSNKFDISTFVPFESRVLVRDHESQTWRPAIWGFYDKNCINHPYGVVGGLCFAMCIPYKDNEYLRGKIKDCDEYFKTWE